MSQKRILVADDPAITRVKDGFASRADVELLTASSTADAVRLLGSTPPPLAAVLPGAGAIDGIAAVKESKAAGVILVLPADTTQRDAAVIAGADDVVVGPADAGLVLRKIEARATGNPFKGAPRATVPLQVNLQNSTGAVLHVQGTGLSREGFAAQLPSGTAPFAPGLLFRATYTLYQGGTFTVWCRSGATLEGRVAMRLVGLTSAEYAAIDYFVDFYNQTPSTVPAVENTGEVELATQPSPAAMGAGDEFRPTTDTFLLAGDCDLGLLAGIAGKLAGGRRDVDEVPGFSATRLRLSVNRLSPSETSALRGTTMYNEILGDLRSCSGLKLKVFELAAQIKSPDAQLDKNVAQQTAFAAIAEAEAIHGRMQEHIQNRLKQGDTRAVRDLNPVTAGLLNACSELKFAVDKHLLGKAVAAQGAAAVTAAAAGPARYDRTEKPVAKEPAPAARSRDGAGAGKRSRAPLVAIGVVLIAFAAWSNRGMFSTPAPQRFVSPVVALQIGDLRVATTKIAGSEYKAVVDDSWLDLDESERAAAVDDLAKRAGAAGASTLVVVDARGKTLATKPAEIPSATGP